MSVSLERRQIGEQFRILEPARLPNNLSGPNRLRVAAMELGGGVGGRSRARRPSTKLEHETTRPGRSVTDRYFAGFAVASARRAAFSEFRML